MFVFVSWYILSRFLYPCGRDDGVVYRVGDGSPDGPDIQYWQHHCWDLADITQTLPQELFGRCGWRFFFQILFRLFQS